MVKCEEMEETPPSRTKVSWSFKKRTMKRPSDLLDQGDDCGIGKVCCATTNITLTVMFGLTDEVNMEMESQMSVCTFGLNGRAWVGLGEGTGLFLNCCVVVDNSRTTPLTRIVLCCSQTQSHDLFYGS